MNRRLRMIGPPAVAPNWFCDSGPRGLPAWLLVQLFAFSDRFWKFSYRLPRRSLEPDFRLTLITAPAARPYSALNPFVCTLISPIASTDGPTAYDVWLRKSMVL